MAPTLPRTKAFLQNLGGCVLIRDTGRTRFIGSHCEAGTLAVARLLQARCP